MLTRVNFRLFSPLTRLDVVDDIFKHWDKYASKFNLIDPKYYTHFLAQTAKESNNFNTTIENLNYSAEALLAMFPRRITREQAYSFGRITTQQAPSFGRVGNERANQEAIANIIYGGEFGKGIGNVKPGDGWLFRGRGFIQLTGRSNYASFAKYKKMTINNTINYLNTIEGCLESAMWFWNSRNINGIIDSSQNIDSAILAVTRRVNGGTNGLEDRSRLTKLAQRIFK